MIDWDEKKEKGRLFAHELFKTAEKTDLSIEEKITAFLTVASLYACGLGFTFDEFKKRLGDVWPPGAEKRLGESLRTLHKIKNDLKTESVPTNGMD